MIEKREALVAQDAQGVHDLADELGLPVMAGYSERFNPAVVALRSNLHRVGADLSILAERIGPRLGETIHLDYLVHDVDLLRFLGLSPDVTGGQTNACGADVSLRIGSGHAVYRAGAKRTIYAFGDAGTLEADLLDHTLRLDGEPLPRSPVRSAHAAVAVLSQRSASIG